MGKERGTLYFISILPPTPIRREIEKIKKEIKEKYGIEHSLKLPAHITIQIPFRMKEEKEKLLFKKLKRFSESIEPIGIELKDFGKFSKNVLFIKVKNHQPIIDLHEKLEMELMVFLNLQSHEISSKIHPHVTIATRDLKRSHFPEIWQEFEEREYQASFTAKKLHLLKHNGKTWELYRSFNFSKQI